MNVELNNILCEINQLSYMPVTEKFLFRITPAYLQRLYQTSLDHKSFKDFKLFTLLTHARLSVLNFEDTNLQNSLNIARKYTGEPVISSVTKKRAYVIDISYVTPSCIQVIEVETGKISEWNIHEILTPDSLEINFLAALSLNNTKLISKNY